MKLPVLVKYVFELLNKCCSYAVLRNFDGLPYENTSRDIDILINKNDYSSIKQSLKELFVKEGYYIVTFFESERICTFVVGRAQQPVDIIQFDFFFHTSAYGNLLIDSNFMLKQRIKENEVYHVLVSFEYLDKYLYLKYIGAPYPQKYKKIEEKALSDSQIDLITKELFGLENFNSLNSMSSREFRSFINKYNFRNRFWKNTANRFKFITYYISNLLNYKGFSISFTGPDGSGKTTVINSCTEVLSNTFSSIHLYHFRPTLFRNLGDVAHNAGLKKEVDHNFNNPHRGSKTGILSSMARLAYYSIDYIIGYFVKIRPKLQTRGVVIFDRYFTDIVCDSKRSRVYLPYKFIYYWGKCFIPSLDYNILLTANSDVILNRKRELDKESIELINAKLEYLQGKTGFYLVLNEETPEETERKILDIVFQKQHVKNLKRL